MLALLKKKILFYFMQRQMNVSLRNELYVLLDRSTMKTIILETLIYKAKERKFESIGAWDDFSEYKYLLFLTLICL